MHLHAEWGSWSYGVFDWITGLVKSLGYWGLALLTLLENVFPPIPSEVILPLGGFLTVRGELNIVGVILAGTLGSLAGATLWYWVGRAIGEQRLRRWVDRHGVWLAMSPEDLDHAEDWFRRHGGKAVLIGRLIPTIRSVISIPAGLTGMSLLPFLLYSAVGTAAWTALLAYAGRLLGLQYERVSTYLNPVTWAIVGGAVLLYIYRVVQLKRASGGSSGAS